MVYDSEFSRKAFLSECSQSGMFFTSPEYQPKSSISTLRTSTVSASPTGISPRETARNIARRYLEGSSRSARDERRFNDISDCNENDDMIGNETSSFSSRFTGRPKVCNCCQNCGGARSGNDRESRLDHPMSSLSLKSSKDMESYIKSRSPFAEDGPVSKPRATYTVRNIPVRNLEELRETVAIRRNYIKERQQMRDGLIPNSVTIDDALSSISITSKNSQLDAEAEGSVCSEFPDSIAVDEESTQ